MVHLLQPGTEPAAWASSVAIGEAHIIPKWPESGRFSLIAVVRGPGPAGKAQTRCLCVTTKEEMDRILSKHTCRILWFTVASYQIENDMIDRTLTEEEYLSHE
jgi:hypothetical protein